MWRIYYADGAVAVGEGMPREPQCYGVLAILHGKTIEHGFDYYLWRADLGDWVGVKGDASLVLQCMHHPGVIAACLAGESVTNEVFQDVMARVVEAQQHD